MNTLQNLHTHTVYCDGKNTPEQVVAAAIEKGFGGIGFSSHSFITCAPELTMAKEKTEAYKNEINSLKRKYEGVIDVFLGLEFDVYSEEDLDGYEYIIASLHNLKMDGGLVPFDRSADAVAKVIDTRFGGDGTAFAKEYYRQLARLPEYGRFDIIGHFDIITKNIEKVRFFDMESEEYLDSALTALDALRGRIPFFEVNTGATARGYRTAPYPALNLLRHFREMGFGAIISSDCHNAEYLDCGFDAARDLLVEAGFRERYILTRSGFCAIAVDG